MAAARSRRADSTDSSSQAAASGSVPELISPSAWARRIRSARCAATARIASRAGSLSAGVAQDLPLPDASFDAVTCTLAMHHVPARQRATAFREMYRVTKSGGRLLVADLDTAGRPLPLHAGGRRMRRAAATVGPLEELAAAAGYRVESTGRLPLLRYVVAIRT
jgi:ubiquinone/menaquinone biosynthesis C-methylase UbiE